MPVTGFVEHADTQRVSGWAYDASVPDSRLEVTVRIGDEFCASGFADIARDDLLRAGIGDGKHGFAIDVTESNLTPEEAAALEVHAISGVEVIRIARVPAGPERIEDLAVGALMPTSDESQFPVFVLGPARSGTSAVALALLESGSYVGSGEGHLMSLAHELLSTVDQHYRRAGSDPGTLAARVPGDAFQRFIRRAFVRLATELFPTPRWLDKTPTVEMVRAAVLMRELWPNARFIFMKRRVVENVLSRRRKFPEGSTENHYEDWAAVMTAWLAVRNRLSGSAIEIDHRDLILEPERVAATVAAFLELPESAAARFGRFIRNSRPEQTDEHFGAIYTIGDLRLEEHETKRMMAVCDPAMTAYGYGYGERYYNSGA